MTFSRLAGLRFFISLLIGGFVVLAFPVMGTASEELVGTKCRSLQAKAGLGIRMPEVASLVANRKPVRIIAIGSSSTEGPRNEDRSTTYPAATWRSLSRLWPRVPVEVINKGRGGEVTADMLARFDEDVLSLNPAVVVWQLGANDVVRFPGVDDLEPMIRAGIRRLTERGIAVILFDLQYAPRILSKEPHIAMEAMIDRLAKEEKVGVFHRFDVMKAAVDHDDEMLTAMTERDGLHMTAATHGCMGELLANAISSAASPLIATQLPVR